MEEDEKDEDDRRGMDDGAESVLRAGASCRLRFFFPVFTPFPFFPPALLLLLLLDDDNPDAALALPPRDSLALLAHLLPLLSYPSQSGKEVNPLSLYTIIGEDGILDGR